MFKVFGFLTKREGMQMQDFIDYYENKHVPLICSLAPTPSLYKRRYIVRGEELTQEGGAVDFDVMTELGFFRPVRFSNLDGAALWAGGWPPGRCGRGKVSR
jgi:EthD domain